MARPWASTHKEDHLMAKRFLLLTAGMAFLLAPVVQPGQAGAGGGTPCTFEFDIVVSPGLTTSPSSGTFTSDGENGTITCAGPVNGHRTAGSGRIGIDGRYGNEKPYSCRDDAQGEGTMRMTFPTSDGTQTITNPFTYTDSAYQEGRLFAGTFHGDRMSGKFQAQPTDGDCVSRPMTRFHIKGDGTLN